MLEKITSIATVDDLGIWALGSKYVKKFIKAGEYRVIVPKKYLNKFIEKNQYGYSVVAEENILSISTIDNIKKYFNSSGVPYGWYLQQFLKIEELRKKSNRPALIWDADTVPLKPISFEDSCGCLLSYKGTEYHLPYFQTIESILGIAKTNKHSFISQCICTRMVDVYNMCEEIEQRNGAYWIDSVLKAIKPEHSQFSEYETIGSYITNRSCETKFIYKNENSWVRNGYKYIPSLILFPILYRFYAKKFDHMTFEKLAKLDRKRKLINLFLK